MEGDFPLDDHRRSAHTPGSAAQGKEIKMAELKPGDTVELKSGGPPMTIKCQTDTGEFWCEWFLNGKLDSDTCTPDSLHLVDPDRPPTI